MLSNKAQSFNQNAMKQRDLDRAHFLKSFQELILQYDHIVIFHHINVDGDCLGAAFGMKEIIQTNYPNKKAYVVGSNHNPSFSWLNMKFDNTVNVNFDFGTTLALVIDVGNSERIEMFDKFFKDDRRTFGAVVKIDHHDVVSDFHVDLTWDDPTYSSTCEQIIQIADYYGWYITPKAATFLYMGCVTDSLSFSVSGVTPRSHVLAAKALRNGADSFRVHTQLATKSWSEFKVASYLTKHAVRTDHIIYSCITKERAIDMGVQSPKSLVNVLGHVEGLWMWMVFVETSSDVLEVSIRSIHASAKDLASRYGGGGHEFAAGCRINKSQLDAFLHDANVMVSAAKQNKFYESQIKNMYDDAEMERRIHEAVLRKNPELIRDSKEFLKEVQKAREEGLFNPDEGKKSIHEGYEQ